MSHAFIRGPGRLLPLHFSSVSRHRLDLTLPKVAWTISPAPHDQHQHFTQPHHIPRVPSTSYNTPGQLELTPGCRLQLLGDEFVRDAGGAAAIVSATHREGRYRLRLDNGTEKLLRLDSERFRLLR